MKFVVNTLSKTASCVPMVGHGPPYFCLAICVPPQFFSLFPVQVRLVDIYSRKLSASNILNDNSEIL